MMFTQVEVEQMLNDARERYLREGAETERKRIVWCGNECFTNVKANDDARSAIERFDGMVARGNGPGSP